MAYLIATCTASRPVQFAPASAIVSRGTGRAALALAREGAARVSARSVGLTSRFSVFCLSVGAEKFAKAFLELLFLELPREARAHKTCRGFGSCYRR